MSDHKDIHSMIASLPPTVLVIFGATGHLAFNYLLPTLLHMDKEGLLPANFKLVAVGRKELTAKTFLDSFLKNTEIKTDKKTLARFSRHILYYQGNFDKPDSFKGLASVIADTKLKTGKHECYNRLYYFATAPDYFKSIAKILKQQGLLIGCTEHSRATRVLVEKPFGENLASAKSLNKLLLQFFNEDQIYRIDHYLGKETVQNLLVMRFANDFLEPVWNAKFIDHIEISALENVGAGDRAGFYDKTGALRDFVQNHLLHMLALIAIDRPKDLSPQSIRNEKVKVLRALKPYSKKDIGKLVIRGQYGASKDQPGYADELGAPSLTETFVALKVFLKLPRWRNVPFYLRTGKKLPRKVTEISVHFKKHEHGLFKESARHPNVLTFRIQPNERVQLQINNKIPGFGIRLHGGNLEFGYKASFEGEIPGAYERLLLDFMEGDQRLFIRSDEIEAAWKFVDSAIGNWSEKTNPMQVYPAGSIGPEAAELMIEKDNRAWRTR
jgi:glucose-6-phosphate 1-dehydrogenase